jgi:hypothetical protein
VVNGKSIPCLGGIFAPKVLHPEGLGAKVSPLPVALWWPHSREAVTLLWRDFIAASTAKSDALLRYQITARSSLKIKDLRVY